MNKQGREGGKSFRSNHTQAFSTTDIQQHTKVSKLVTADLSKEKLKHDLLDFCKISFSFTWGCNRQSYKCQSFSWCI